jgi:hypothetical protein
MAAGWAAARNRKEVQVLVVAICLAQWMTVNFDSFEPAQARANQSPWLLPIVTDPTALTDLSDAIRRTSTFSGYNIVAIEDPVLNSNSAAFFAAKNRFGTGVRSQYTSTGYAQKDTGAAMKRIDELSAKFVLTLDEPFQPATPNFLNVVALPVLRELKRSEDFTRVPFPSEKGILIFERKNPNSAPAHP